MKIGQQKDTMSTKAEKPEKAGPIGRLARLVLGVVVLRWFIGFATGYGSVVQPTNLALHFWAGVGAWSHVLGTLIPPLREGKKRAMVLIPLIVLALVLDTVLFRDWWGPPFAILLYMLALVGSGVLGVEFVLAGLMGIPGCESTAIANLLRHGATPKIESCPLWDPIDRWEQRTFGERAAEKPNWNGGE